MEIAFCLDNNYIQYCATAIASILSNNQNEHITFHVLSNNLTNENKLEVRDWLTSYKNKFIFFHNINPQTFKSFPIENAYINITTYYRLLLPDILKDIDKVLYLDCDVIINSSLLELWNTDISNYAVAGIRDRINDNIRLYNRLRYNITYGYINAGVLLINLKKWREENVFAKALSIAIKSPAILKNHDQDIINILFYNSKKILDFKYNLLEYYLYTEDWLYLDRKYYPEIIEACKNPVIVHFCMPQKPWHIECINPYKELYYKYRKMTPWPELKLTHKKEKLSKKQKLKLTLEKLGLYKVERKSTLRRDINIIEDPNNILF